MKCLAWLVDVIKGREVFEGEKHKEKEKLSYNDRHLLALKIPTVRIL